MDDDLEKAIDEVWRDKVFARATSHGWHSGATPPKWVWWGIVEEIRANKPPPASSNQEHINQIKNIFGF